MGGGIVEADNAQFTGHHGDKHGLVDEEMNLVSIG
jgi:hypothetical protein